MSAIQCTVLVEATPQASLPSVNYPSMGSLNEVLSRAAHVEFFQLMSCDELVWFGNLKLRVS